MSPENDTTETDSTNTWDRRDALKVMGATGVGLVGASAASGNAAAAGPTAVIDTNPLPVTEGTTVTFDGSNSTGDITKYEWYRNSAGDGFYGVVKEGETFSESFAQGDFSIKLKVTDSNGNTDTSQFSFKVYGDGTATAPIPRIEMVRGGDGEITFDGTRSTSPRGEIVEYEWSRNSAGDGFYGVNFTGPGFFENFADGDFDVRLRVTDEEGQTAEKVITITV
ncbi:PKD domain-containing protein [Halorussus halophilus]|uniref:PKD domain-containing protein n=1 Tax=Halorussus halophilus TaxID=2650975 RepID=UPI001301877F|nr:PKD domain-containing protein [Halorussus halophilus]